MSDPEHDGSIDTGRANGRHSSVPSVDWGSPETLDVGVVGAGAMGGLLGGRLAAAGATVTLIDQGPHRDAMAEQGLTLVERDGNRRDVEPSTVTGDVAAVEPPELLVIGVKAYDLPAVAPTVARLAAPETVILPIQNGIPWWYFHRFDGDLERRRISAVDPDGVIDHHIDTDQVLGCVPFAAGTIVEPGVVKHTEGEWFPVAELDGAETPRVRGVATCLERAGLRSRVLPDVRSELWLKALGNLAFNPISALTGATLGEICRTPETRALVRTMMEESKAVAEELGVSFRRSIDDRIEGAEAVGDHRTSMLQDAERGNRLEYEALLGTVIELAECTDQPVPTVETVYGLTKLLAETNSS
jgi:2-dehydropantoate 2-reductase